MLDPFVLHCTCYGSGGETLDRRFLIPRYGADRVQRLSGPAFAGVAHVAPGHVARAMRSHAASGPVPVGFVARVYPRAVTVVVLEDPVARILATLGRAEATREGSLRDPDDRVRHALDDPGFTALHGNLQTRLAAGRALLDTNAGAADPERARANLSRRDVLVGDAARLDAFIAHLDGVLPEPDPRPPLALPEPERRPLAWTQGDISPALVDRIRAANDLDLRLYDAVARRPLPGQTAAA